MGSCRADRARRPGRGPRTRSRPSSATTERCAWCRDRCSLGYLLRRWARVGVERRAQPAHRVMKSRVGRADRDTDDLGDPFDAAGRGSDEGPPRSGVRVRAVESHARADRGRQPSRSHHPPPRRQPAGGGDWVPSDVPCGPRRSRRARGADTTRLRSAPGRGASAGRARCSAVPAASRPRRGRGRAGSCAQPPGTDPHTRRQGWRTPPCHRAELASRVRCPFALPHDRIGSALIPYGRVKPMEPSNLVRCWNAGSGLDRCMRTSPGFGRSDVSEWGLSRPTPKSRGREVPGPP